MPSDATVSPSTLVARFLRTNGYVDTLSAFIREAGLPRDVGSNTGSGSWTIEKIIDEKKAYDKTLNFERLGEEGEGERDKWTLPGELGSVVPLFPLIPTILYAAQQPFSVLRPPLPLPPWLRTHSNVMSVQHRRNPRSLRLPIHQIYSPHRSCQLNTRRVKQEGSPLWLLVPIDI